jgi:hypothetical protein
MVFFQNVSQEPPLPLRERVWVRVELLVLIATLSLSKGPGDDRPGVAVFPLNLAFSPRIRNN